MIIMMLVKQKILPFHPENAVVQKLFTGIT